MNTLFASAALAALISSAALAQESETRQLGAHVHGEARLSVAIDPASGLALAELSGAAWNFYGFEGAPQTEEQRETMAAARTTLSAEGLIAWPQRAGCALQEVSVDAVMSGEGDDHDHGHDHDHSHDDDHDHGDHAHDHHDHEPSDHGHDEHDHDHGHGAHAHNDVTVSWTWMCERTAAASRFDADGVFQALPRLERLEAEAFDGTRAAVRTLTPGDAGIALD